MLQISKNALFTMQNSDEKVPQNARTDMFSVTNFNRTNVQNLKGV